MKFSTVDFHRTNENQTKIYNAQILIANPYLKHSSNEGVVAIARRWSISVQPQNHHIFIPHSKISQSYWLNIFYEMI